MATHRRNRCDAPRQHAVRKTQSLLVLTSSQVVAHFRSHQASFAVGSNTLLPKYPASSAYELVGIRWVMSKKQRRLAQANAEKLVYIFNNFRAFRITNIGNLHDKY